MADSKLRKDENLDIDIKRWENEFLKISVWVIRIKKLYWFFAREFATGLGYTDPRDPIKDLIDSEDKKTMEELLGKDYKKVLEKCLNLTLGNFPRVEFFQIVRRNQKLTNEFGLYSFCTKSRKEKAKPFQRWIFNTIKTIRETGSYTLPGGAIENPLDLIAKVSNLEKEIKTLKKETKTCDKSTQTPKTIDPYRLRDKLVKSLRKTEKEIRETKDRLKSSLEKISPHHSSSSSYSSPPRYSSDSE